jgi:hypothetical protein
MIKEISPDFREIVIDLEVADLKHLNGIITELRTKPVVSKVEPRRRRNLNSSFLFFGCVSLPGTQPFFLPIPQCFLLLVEQYRFCYCRARYIAQKSGK